MTRIGIISDTHIRDNSKRVIPQQVFEAWQKVDLILHGGDFTTLEVLRTLESLAPVIAVRGNNDFGDLSTLPISKRVDVEETVIGLAHGDLPSSGRRVKPLQDAPGNREAAANAISHFEFDDDIRCIIFGHSHHPLMQEREIDGRKVFLLNPGSPTDRRNSPHFGCALLEIHQGVIRPELVTW